MFKWAQFHIAHIFLIRKFYCFRKGRHIYFKYARHNHLPDENPEQTFFPFHCLSFILRDYWLLHETLTLF